MSIANWRSVATAEAAAASDMSASCWSMTVEAMLISSSSSSPFVSALFLYFLVYMLSLSFDSRDACSHVLDTAVKNKKKGNKGKSVMLISTVHLGIIGWTEITHHEEKKNRKKRRKSRFEIIT